jgi:hypothetical protein
MDGDIPGDAFWAGRLRLGLFRCRHAVFAGGLLFFRRRDAFLEGRLLFFGGDVLVRSSSRFFFRITPVAVYLSTMESFHRPPGGIAKRTFMREIGSVSPSDHFVVISPPWGFVTNPAQLPYPGLCVSLYSLGSHSKTHLSANNAFFDNFFAPVSTAHAAVLYVSSILREQSGKRIYQTPARLKNQPSSNARGSHSKKISSGRTFCLTELSTHWVRFKNTPRVSFKIKNYTQWVRQNFPHDLNFQCRGRVQYAASTTVVCRKLATKVTFTKMTTIDVGVTT